jgi:hypothetical protein
LVLRDWPNGRRTGGVDCRQNRAATPEQHNGSRRNRLITADNPSGILAVSSWYPALIGLRIQVSQYLTGYCIKENRKRENNNPENVGYRDTFCFQWLALGYGRATTALRADYRRRGPRGVPGPRETAGRSGRHRQRGCAGPRPHPCCQERRRPGGPKIAADLV